MSSQYGVSGLEQGVILAAPTWAQDSVDRQQKSSFLTLQPAASVRARASRGAGGRSTAKSYTRGGGEGAREGIGGDVGSRTARRRGRTRGRGRTRRRGRTRGRRRRRRRGRRRGRGRR